MSQIFHSSQTSDVKEYRVLWTPHKTQKLKHWHDGYLRFHTFNNRMLLYDDARTLVADKYKKSGPPDVGDDLDFEHHLVTVDEFIQTVVQDLSPVFSPAIQRRQKRAAAGAQGSPLAARSRPPALHASSLGGRQIGPQAGPRGSGQSRPMQQSAVQNRGPAAKVSSHSRPPPQALAPQNKPRQDLPPQSQQRQQQQQQMQQMHRPPVARPQRPAFATPNRTPLVPHQSSGPLFNEPPSDIRYRSDSPEQDIPNQQGSNQPIPSPPIQGEDSPHFQRQPRPRQQRPPKSPPPPLPQDRAKPQNQAYARPPQNYRPPAQTRLPPPRSDDAPRAGALASSANERRACASIPPTALRPTEQTSRGRFLHNQPNITPPPPPPPDDPKPPEGAILKFAPARKRGKLLCMNRQTAQEPIALDDDDENEPRKRQKPLTPARNPNAPTRRIEAPAPQTTTASRPPTKMNPPLPTKTDFPAANANPLPQKMQWKAPQPKKVARLVNSAVEEEARGGPTLGERQAARTDYEDSGPWSREAEWLFDWKPPNFKK